MSLRAAPDRGGRRRTATRAPPGPVARAACPAGWAGPRPGASPGGRRRDAAPPGCRLGWAARRRPDGLPAGRRRSCAPSGPREGAPRPGCRWRRSANRRAAWRRRLGHRSGRDRGGDARPPFWGAGSGATGGAAAVAGSSAMRLSPLRVGRGPGSGTGVGISPVRSPAGQPARCDWLGAGAGRSGTAGTSASGRTERPAPRSSRGAAGTRRGPRPVGERHVDHAQLDQVERTERRHAQLSEPECGGQFAHGTPRGPRPRATASCGRLIDHLD